MSGYTVPTNIKFAFFWNTASATLWFCCLGRFAILLPLVGRKFLPGGIADFFHVVSLIPIFTFFMYKGLLNGKNNLDNLWSLFNGTKMAWLSYGVIFPHPKIAKHTSYSFLILSWCLMNLVHFVYHAFRIRTRSSPKFLFWLQYHNFYLTFPMALVSEMILLFLSLEFVSDDLVYEFFIKLVLLCYIPVGYFTWNYMYQRKQLRYDTVVAKRLQRRNSAGGNVVAAHSSALSSTASTITPEQHELSDMHTPTVGNQTN